MEDLVICKVYNYALSDEEMNNLLLSAMSL